MRLGIRDLLSIDHCGSRGTDRLRRAVITGVSTDSRTVKRREVFVALRGESFDGHSFIHQAAAGGAACAIVDRDFDGRSTELPLIVVEDTTVALAQLALLHRMSFRIPVIAVAGSNGKTTTREMIAAVLRTHYGVLSTRGNLNNQIGVPQTLFRLTEKHDVAVVEIGTNHHGELQRLCGMLRPTHGLITNIGREHLEFFRNLKGVAKEEGALFAALGTSRRGFVNADDPMVAALARGLRHATAYGFSARRADVRGRFLAMDGRGRARFAVSGRGVGEFPVTLSMPGLHAMRNALAAAAVGLAFGVAPRNIQRALNAFAPVGKRMEVVRAGGLTIVNDTYNANPDSVMSALETVQAMTCRGRKVVVLADMLELGAASEREHRAVGKAVGAMGFDALLTHGPMARRIGDAAAVRTRRHYASKRALAGAAARLAGPGGIVLVKGSRGMKMEEVVDAMRRDSRKRTR